MRGPVVVTVAGLMVSITGCGGVNVSGIKSSAEASILGSEVNGSELTERFDLNGDGSPDVWKVSFMAEGSDEKILLRKTLDVNFDGKVDITKYYDRSEKMEREELDLDFDGKVDAVNLYEDGVLKVREVDTSFDGQTDVWKFYSEGMLVRKERDGNGDGAVDSWEYFKDGKLTRVGSDRDGDGEPEFFEDAPAGS